MKRLWWLTIIIELIGTFPSYAHDKLLIYAEDYEPYYGENLPDFGPIAKITCLAFREVGYDVELKFRPWARVIKEGQEGKCDVIMGVWFNTGRETWMTLTDAMLENEVGFYKRKNDDLVFKNYTDLKEKGVVVGIVRDYINPEGFNKAGLKTEAVAGDLLNMKKLVNGRIRLALVDKRLGAYLLKKTGEENKIEWLVTLQKIPLRNGIMKNARGDWKKKLNDFNKGLALLKKRGVVARILK